MKLQHRFTCEQTESDDMDFPNMRIDVEIDGNTADIFSMCKQFEYYLIASGFILPGNTHIGLVEDKQSGLPSNAEHLKEKEDE